VLANKHIGNQGGCPLCSIQCEDCLPVLGRMKSGEFLV
jgi:hypothetical protein